MFVYLLILTGLTPPPPSLIPGCNIVYCISINGLNMLSCEDRWSQFILFVGGDCFKEEFDMAIVE